MTPTLETGHGEPSYLLTSDSVRAHLTARGGHLGPVEFTLAGGLRASPYSVAPWLPDEHPGQPPLLQVLRGDFFCFPFGGDVEHPTPHGDTANAPWHLVNATADSLVLALDLASPAGGRVEKTVSLRPGHAALYQEHRISGVSGDFNYGHHPILHIPPEVTVELRASPARFGGVYAYPASTERNALAAGARFSSLASVPLARGGSTSLLRYPARPGHEDIVMFTAAQTSGPAWTALTFPGYVWVSLRDAADFPSTLLWMSDGGRDGPPWDGRHTRRIGVEDVCSHYCDGATVSAQDRLRAEGIATARTFRAGETTVLRHLQFVVAVPPGFGGLAELVCHEHEAAVTLRGENGAHVTAPLDWRFVLAARKPPAPHPAA